jgi:hypothetical protein
MDAHGNAHNHGNRHADADLQPGEHLWRRMLFWLLTDSLSY